MPKEVEEKEDSVVFIDDSPEETIVDLSPEVKESKSDSNDDRLSRAEAETARLRAQIDQDRSVSYGNQRQQHQEDPFDQELSSINDRERSLGVQWEVDKASGRLRDKSVVDEYDRKAREIQDQKSSVSTRKALRDMLPQITQAQQHQQIRQQYSDIYSNQHALTYAQGAYQMSLAKGEADGPQLLDKAMNEARVHFRMPGASRMKPSQQDKNQLAGIPGGGGRHSVDNTVRMGKAEKQMAEAMYIDAAGGDQQKAWGMWAKKIGVRAKKAASKNRNA